MELLQWAGSCATMCRLADGLCCHAWPLRSLFCLQLLYFISATPHMPPSGFQSEKFFIKHDYQTRCQLFIMSQPCYWRSKLRCRALRGAPGTTANLAPDDLSQELPLISPSKFSLLIAPSETPTRKFHHLGLCLGLTPVCPSCSKPCRALPSLAGLLTPLSQHFNQTSAGEEVVYFTFKHSVTADTCHNTCRLVKIQVFKKKIQNLKGLKWSSSFPLTSFLQGPGRILLLSSTVKFWVPYSYCHFNKRCNTIALRLGHFSKKQEVLVTNYVWSPKELIWLVLLLSQHGGLTTVLINTSVPQPATNCCQQSERVAAEEVNGNPPRTSWSLRMSPDPARMPCHRKRSTYLQLRKQEPCHH